MEFSRPEYWSGYPLPSPGDLPIPGIKPRSPALQVNSLPAEPQGKPKNTGLGSLALLQQISPTRNQTGVPWIAGRFFTNEHMLFSSVQFSHSVMSDSLWPHGLQHARPPFPSPTPRAYSNSCPLSWWCHPTTSSFVVPFFSHLQSFLTSGSFQMSQFFSSGGQSIGVSVSTSVLPMNIQDWFPLGWTDWISLQSKGLSRVFSNSTVQKHQFFSAQLSLWSNSHIHTLLLEKL